MRNWVEGSDDDVDQDARDPHGPMRTLHVLEALAGMEQPASLSTIATSMNLTKSKAYRALRALQDQGFIDHAGRSGYRLGSRSIALASLIGPRRAVLRTARPVLARHRLGDGVAAPAQRCPPSARPRRRSAQLAAARRGHGR